MEILSLHPLLMIFSIQSNRSSISLFKRKMVLWVILRLPIKLPLDSLPSTQFLFSNIDISFGQILTGIAFSLFEKENVDIAVIEVSGFAHT